MADPPEAPESTIPPPPGAGGNSGGPADQTSNIYRHMYLSSSGNNAAFTRLINLLLDNKVFVQDIFAETGGEYAQQDVFGLGFDMSDATTNMEMVDLQTDEGRSTIKKYLSAQNPDSIISDAQIDAHVGDNRFMYKLPEAFAGDSYLTDTARESGPIGIIASLDGTPYGTVDTVREALMGMDLHRSSIDRHMKDLQEMSPEGFRGIQAELMMLGYYDQFTAPAEGVDVTWGLATEIDRMAWNSFIQDLINTSLEEGDKARSAGIKPSDWEGISFDDHIDKRFNERMEMFRQKTLTPSESPSSDTYQSMKTRLNDAIQTITGSADPALTDAIDQTLTNLISEGEINISEALNQDILGFAVSDENVAKADAFLYEFFGGENWEDNIVLGANGSTKELKRIAKEAGVDTAVHPLFGAEASSDGKKQMARYFFHILDQNAGQGDMYRTAQLFGNSFGQMHMQNEGMTSGSIEAIMKKLDAMEWHPAYAGSMHDSNIERLAAFDSIEKRVQSAMDLTEWDEKTDQKDRVMIDVLRGLGGGSQRKSRFA